MEEKLIESVRMRPILYDTSNVDYIKIKLKTEIWEGVAKESDIRNRAEAKALWEKLRHSFRDAIRRQQKYVKSGAPATNIKPWKFQKQMGFLQPFMANKEREGNLQGDPVDHILSQSGEDDVRPANEDEEQHMQNIPIESECLEDQLNDPLEISPSTSTTNPPFAKRMKKANVASMLKQSMDKREERARVRTKERAQLLEHLRPTQDPLFHFFMSMYETTKRMPPTLQYEVRKRVFNAVTDVEATLLNMPKTPQEYSFNQSPNQTYSATTTPGNSSYSDSSCSYMGTKNDEILPPASESSRISLVNLINDFSE